MFCSVFMVMPSKFAAIFSAYSDIAIGVAALLGYQFLPISTHPIARTLCKTFGGDGTLSTWLRDYFISARGLGGALFDVSQLAFDNAPRRFVAWCGMEFCGVGRAYGSRSV